jgi:hypothetical protein
MATRGNISRIYKKYQSQNLVMIPYEINENSIIPITVNTTTRQQIKFRLTNGRFTLDK